MLAAPGKEAAPRFGIGFGGWAKIGSQPGGWKVTSVASTLSPTGSQAAARAGQSRSGTAGTGSNPQLSAAVAATAWSNRQEYSGNACLRAKARGCGGWISQPPFRQATVC